MSQESQAISHNISMLLTEGRSAEARAELERLLALDPDDPEARSLAGDVYAYTGAHSAAYKQYNLAAETFNRLGRADMALAVHHKILELDTGVLDAPTQTRIRLLGLLVAAEDAIVRGDNERSVAGYKEAIRQFPNHTITYQRLANLLVRLNRMDEAAEQYLTVARAFYAHGVLPKARPYFERVLELRPAQPEALDAVLACLDAENKAGEGERFLKGAVQAHLQQGRNEEAAALFERLTPSTRDGASPLGAALLLQSGEVNQAERMVAGLDLARPEMQDWFKSMGRGALERGDSVAADAYFRWSQGKLAPAPAPVSAPAPVAAPPPPPAVPPPPPVEPPPVPAPPAAPPPRPVPPPGLGTPPPPPPGLGVPPPPPPGLGVPPPPPPPPVPAPVAAAPVAAAPVAAAPVAPPPAPVSPVSMPTPAASLPSAPPAPTPKPSGETPPEDRTVLQTMGEMCLAEEMFEEAKQVFERLARADPGNERFWELLNRARSGLGLSPVFPSAAEPTPEASPAVVLAPTPAPVPPPPLVPPKVVTVSEQQSLPELEPLARRSRVPMEKTGLEQPQLEWAPIPEPPLLKPVIQVPTPAPPASTPRPAPVPARTRPAVPAAIPVAAGGGGRIERTQYVVSLGELPPAVASSLDESDDIIE